MIVFACCIAIALLAVVRFPAARADEARTLREALAAEGISVEGASLANLDKKITSGATLNDANQFLIAYYLDDGSGLLKAPLYLDRLDRKSKSWTGGALRKGDSHPEATDSNCYGAVLDISSLLDRYVLETHINPSAGCALIVSRDLKLEATLYGWVLGHFEDGTIIFHRSQIHFATVHPAEIAVYLQKTKKDFTIFPPQSGTPVRTALTAELRDFYRSRQEYCAKANDPCDPAEFDSSLAGKIAVDDRSHAAAFTISYDLQGYGQDTNKPAGPSAVIYVYRHLDDPAKAECRELLPADVKTRFGDIPLQEMLEPARLEMIFQSGAGPQSQEREVTRLRTGTRSAPSTLHPTDRR